MAGRRGVKSKVKRRAVTAVDALEMLTCPSGHRLPNLTEKGNCTPQYCMDPLASRPLTGEEKKFTKAAKVVELGEDDLDFKLKKMTRRLQVLGVPDTDDPAEIEKWADRRIAQMLKKAVAEVDYRLTFGDDDERYEAAGKVLDATGRGRKDANGALAPAPMVVVFNGPGGMESLPFLRRTAPIGSLPDTDKEKK